MITKFRIYLIVGLVLSQCMVAFASTSNGTIDGTYSYAWSENLGWINFGSSEGDVHITDASMTGYAWGENVGWISLNCSNTSSCATVDYKVSNDTHGSLSGYAWGENVGWINFSPTYGGVSVSSAAGDFSGYAWGENTGWIVFNCSDTSSCGSVNYKVTTDYRPTSAGGGGGGGSQNPVIPPSSSVAPSVSTSPAASSVPSPQVTPAPSVIPSSSPSSLPPVPSVIPVNPPPSVEPSAPPSSVFIPPSPGPITASSSVPEAVVATVTQAVNNVATVVSNVFSPLTKSEPIKIPQEVTLQAQKIIDAVPGGVTTVSTATVVTATTTVTSTVAIMFSYFKSLLDLSNYVSYLGVSFLQVLALKRRSKPWGTVYDGVTKQPIPFAKIQLLDESSRVLETKVTDLAGRYGFLVAEKSGINGSIKIQLQASKSGYTFPSQHVTGNVDTVLYSNVYVSGLIDVDPDRLARFDIPLDSIKPPVGTMETLHSLKLKNLWVRLIDTGSWLLFFLLPLQYLARPHILNLLALLVSFGLLVVRASGLRPRNFGAVVDIASERSMPFSLITLNDSKGQRVDFTVSNELGRYFLLVPRGEYEMVAYTSTAVIPSRSSTTTVTGKKGWINKEIKL
jgi:hypothetical protein